MDRKRCFACPKPGQPSPNLPREPKPHYEIPVPAQLNQPRQLLSARQEAGISQVLELNTLDGGSYTVLVLGHGQVPRQETV